MTFTVDVRHDAAARLWYVYASDLPGLHAEATTFDELVAIIEDVAPVLADDMPAVSDRDGEIAVRVQHLVSAKRRHAA